MFTNGDYTVMTRENEAYCYLCPLCGGGTEIYGKSDKYSNGYVGYSCRCANPHCRTRQQGDEVRSQSWGFRGIAYNIWLHEAFSIGLAENLPMLFLPGEWRQAGYELTLDNVVKFRAEIAELEQQPEDEKQRLEERKRKGLPAHKRRGKA